MAPTRDVGYWFEWILRLILAAFFVSAGVIKILDPKSLVAAIETYQVLPYRLSFLLAFFLPWVEVVAGVGILLKKLYRGSLFSIAGLLVLFIIALAQGWFRGLDVTCGCFGGASHENQTNYGWLILRDLLLLVVVGTLWIRQAQEDRQ
ncbi:MAG: DoxX family protein [Verrucomicrobiae bacterium]|nr:DoxX family protein [Verrucomicrobiae bacterium]